MYKKKHSVSHLKKTGTPLENSQHSAPLPHHYLQGGSEVLHSMTTRGKCKHKKNDRHHLGKLPQFLVDSSDSSRVRVWSNTATWSQHLRRQLEGFRWRCGNTNGNSSAVLSPGKKKIPPGIFNFFKTRKMTVPRKTARNLSSTALRSAGLPLKNSGSLRM